VPKPKPGTEPIHNQAAAEFQNRMLLSFLFQIEPVESHPDPCRKEQFLFAGLQKVSQNLKNGNKTPTHHFVIREA